MSVYRLGPLFRFVPNPVWFFLIVDDDYPFMRNSTSAIYRHHARMNPSVVPMMLSPEEFTVSMYGNAPVSHGVISGGIGYEWISTNGRLRLFNDDPDALGRTPVFLETRNIPAPVDPIDFNITIYRSGEIVANVNFLGTIYGASIGQPENVFTQHSGRVFALDPGSEALYTEV
jgi:hypothetical protein